MSEDEKKWMIIGGVSVLVACGLGYLSRQTAKTAIRLEEAMRVMTEANPVEDTYVCVRGKVEPVGQSLVGPYSGEQCVAYKTYVKTRWQEREAKVTNVKGKRSVSWGAWKAMAESINEPVTSSVPFLVVHTEQGRQGTIAASVSVDARLQELPLVLRYSKLMEESPVEKNASHPASPQQSNVAMPTIIINNNNSNSNSNNNTNSGGGGGGGFVVDGQTERKDLGTLREETLLPFGDGRTIAIWGMLKRDYTGTLVVSSDYSQKSIQPFIATWEQPSRVVSEHRSKANVLFWLAIGVGAFGAIAGGWNAAKYFEV